MADLVNLESCDDELPLLYRSFEVILLFAERDIDTAEKRLDYLRGCLDYMSEEHRFFYYINMGVLNITRELYEDGLKFCKQALKIYESHTGFLPEESERLHYSIASCYSSLAFPHRTIFHLLKVRGSYIARRTNNIGFSVDITLALNYIKINALDEANKLLENCIMKSKSTKDDFSYGWAVQGLARLHMKTQNWVYAIEHLDQALNYFEKGTRPYLSTLYRKIRCLADNKKFADARRLLEETRLLSSEDEIYSTAFEALSHYITIKKRITSYNNQSAEYLETVILPIWEKDHDYFEAIDYYKLLEDYYEDKNAKKSSLMSKSIRRIYERCLFHH